MPEAEVDWPRLEIEVDGIVSTCDPWEYYVAPMFSLCDDGSSLPAAATLLCSDPPTEEELAAWVRGELDW